MYVSNSNTGNDTMTITNAEDVTVMSRAIVNNEDGSVTVTNQDGTDMVYTYDKNKNITSIKKDNSNIASYVYDGLEQLTRENYVISNKTYIYTYDRGGNILSKKIYNYTTGTLPSEPLDTITYGYNNTSWKDLLTSYDGQSIIYDAIGNPVQYRDGLEFTWRYGRSLATATTEDGDVISYEYNKDGIRTSKTINGITTTYKLHGSDIVKETTGNTEKWYLYDENSELLGISINGISYYYEKNIQGDIIGLIDSDGDTVVTYSYDAWGNVTEITGNETLASQNPEGKKFSCVYRIK